MSLEKDLFKLAETIAGGVAKIVPLVPDKGKKPEEKEEPYFKRQVSDMQIQREILQFKMQVLKSMPLYGDVLMNLQFVEDKKIKTACTNGLVVYYNPDFLRTQTQGRMNYILMHEVFHIILMHSKRGPDRDPKLWNIACDCVVNGMLDKLLYAMNSYEIPFNRPLDGCFLRSYNGQSADEIYNLLLKTSTVNAKGKVLNVYAVEGYKNQKRELELDDMDLIDISTEDAILVGLDGADIEEIQKQVEAQIKEMLRNAISSAKRSNFGSYYVPNALIKLVETKRLPWKKLLQQYMDTEISDEYSYFTPERKYIHMDLLIPGPERTEETLGTIWAFVDTSGSIGNEDLNKFLTQLYQITRDCKCELNLAYWDTEVTEVYKKIRNKEQLLAAQPHHSGGTNINCIYKYIEDNNINPLAMLILTDGYYGTVIQKPLLKKLKKKTIVVLSQSVYVPNDIDLTGRYTRL